MTPQDLAVLYRHARESRGLSKVAASRLTGISLTSLWRIEQGDRLAYLAKMLTALEKMGMKLMVRRQTDPPRIGVVPLRLHGSRGGSGASPSPR